MYKTDLFKNLSSEFNSPSPLLANFSFLALFAEIEGNFLHVCLGFFLVSLNGVHIVVEFCNINNSYQY